MVYDVGDSLGVYDALFPVMMDCLQKAEKTRLSVDARGFLATGELGSKVADTSIVRITGGLKEVDHHGGRRECGAGALQGVDGHHRHQKSESATSVCTHTPCACVKQISLKLILTDVLVTVECATDADVTAMVLFDTGKYVTTIESDCGCLDALEQHLAVVGEQV